MTKIIPTRRIVFFLSVLIAAGFSLACAVSGCNIKRAVIPAGIRNEDRQGFDFGRFEREAEAAMSGLDGAAVVMRPKTGRVLALVNPESAVYSEYPVGSAFKPVTVTAAIEEGIATPARTGMCNGTMLLGGKTLKCWLAQGHGRLDMFEALARSCNIYFYGLGAGFHGPELARWARAFGFGEKPGFAPQDKAGREASGHVPDTFPPDFAPLFAAGDTTDLRASPMQMAVYLSAIANGGKVLKPHTEDAPVRVVRELNAARGLKVAVEGMRRCVESPEGTCRALVNLGYDAAGKTGTARWGDSLRTHAWFMGFSPVDEPEVAVVVFIRRGRGETDAVPTARKIFQAFYNSKK